jgi:hypothetical protein
MKNTYINKFLTACLFGFGLTAGLTACTFEDDDYFEESPALRVEHAAEKVQDILVSAPNGWVMQYFCGSSVGNFEGFNLFARFDKSGKVIVAGNHRYLRDGNANKYTESESIYNMLQEDGLVLAFNTWNDVLTPFSDPVDPSAAPNSLVKDGAGMGGDYNFVVISYNDNEIILRGERHSGAVRLVKCDRTWQEYIDATNELKNAITNTSINSYYVIADADTLYFTNLRGGVTRYTENLTNFVKLDYLSNCFTPQGFRFEHQDSIGSHAFHEFTLAEDKTCLLNEDGSVKVVACWDDYIVRHTAVWKMDESLFSAEQKSLYNQIEEAAKTFNAAWSLAGIGLGKSTGSNSILGLVLTFYTNMAKTKTNTAGVALTMSRSAYGQMVIDYNSDCAVDKNMESIVKKSANMENLARAFAATLKGSYEMTPDDFFLPTGGEFTAIGSGTSFKMGL